MSKRTILAVPVGLQLEAEIEELIRKGRYVSKSDLARTALRELLEREGKKVAPPGKAQPPPSPNDPEAHLGGETTEPI